MLSLLGAMLSASWGTIRGALGFLVMNDNIWINVGPTYNIGRNVLHVACHRVMLGHHLLTAWGRRGLLSLSRDLAWWQLLLLCVVDGLRLRLNRLSVVLRLAHVLLVCVHFLMLHRGSQIRVIVKWLFTVLLLEGEIAIMGRHLLRLVVRVCWEALDQLVVLLDLLLVVLHRL